MVYRVDAVYNRGRIEIVAIGKCKNYPEAVPAPFLLETSLRIHILLTFSKILKLPV